MSRPQRQVKSTNRSRKQARAVRTQPAVETAGIPPTDNLAESVASVPATRSARPYQAGKKGAKPQPVVVAKTISREQEYAFIREDLQRLLITSGILTVVMIALLFVIDR